MVKWKTLILTAALTVGIGCLTGAKAQALSVNINRNNFPDDSIRTYVQDYDTNKDGMLSEKERRKVKSFSISYFMANKYAIKNKQIVNFAGMQYFPNIKSVSLDLEYEVSKGKVSKWNYEPESLMENFPNMQELYIATRKGQKIVLRGRSKKLTQLYCSVYDCDRLGGGIDSTLYAPNVDTLFLLGKWIPKNKNLGRKFPNAKDVWISESNLGGGNTFEGMKKVETLDLDVDGSTSVNVQPLRGTLKEFKLGFVEENYFSAYYMDDRCCRDKKVSKIKPYTLDLSGMKELKDVYVGEEQKIKAAKLWDSKTKKGAPKLRNLRLYYTQITSLDATGAPKLECLFVGNTLKKLNVNNNKKLRELGLISDKKMSLKIANPTLRSISIIGKKVKKLDVTQCPNLMNISGQRLTINQLDCSKNRKLYSFYLSGATIKKLLLPKVQQSKRLRKQGYAIWEKTKINVMDLSSYTKLNNYIKKFQLGNGFTYQNKMSRKKSKIKKIVINKNLRKSDKKWVKKMAKKQKIKVVEK